MKKTIEAELAWVLTGSLGTYCRERLFNQYLRKGITFFVLSMGIGQRQWSESRIVTDF